MNTISHFGSLDALARLQPATAAAGGVASAGASRNWFDAGPASETLVGEVEAGARGLGVAQHADRILGLLMVEDRSGHLG